MDGGEVEEGRGGRVTEETGRVLPGKLKILADPQEMGGELERELRKRGVEVEAVRLEVGDFVVSDRVVVERKSTRDFLRSILDGRLMDQAERMREKFEKPVLVVEGREDPEELGKLHPHAVQGAILHLVMELGIPVLRTVDSSQTASLLWLLARREREEGRRPPPLRRKRGDLPLPLQQRFVVEGLPGVSSVLAERLLQHFGSVEAVMRASEEELMRVKGIGRVKARRIRELLTLRYGDAVGTPPTSEGSP
ncbi:MAG: ERCC4 domain-containing protein [Candidatus Hadarchaeales archaeon]